MLCNHEFTIISLLINVYNDKCIKCKWFFPVQDGIKSPEANQYIRSNELSECSAIRADCGLNTEVHNQVTENKEKDLK